MSLETQIVRFEKRDKKPLDNVLAWPAAIESIVDATVTAETNGENGGVSCENGVCVLAWKPRRPTAAA